VYPCSTAHLLHLVANDFVRKERMSNNISKTGYTQIFFQHTIHLLGSTPSMTIRWPTNVTEDEQRLLFQKWQ
jgi:hypothetical protein